LKIGFIDHLKNITFLSQRYLLTITPAQLNPLSLIVENLEPMVDTHGSFNVRGYDIYGNLASFQGNDSLGVELSPTCVVNPYPVCTLSNISTSYNCTYNVSLGGEYCIFMLYKGNHIPFVGNNRVLITGGFQCQPACLNQGFCEVSAPVNSTNSTTAYCYCPPGFTGPQCQYKIIPKYMRLSLAIGLMVGLSLLLLLIGILIGFFLVPRAKSIRNRAEIY